MKVVPVLFEDHNLVRMRPVAWSTPQFELRCGIFNLRERVALCFDEPGGFLLGRSMLSGLSTAEDWKWGTEGLVSGGAGGDRFLFLNGGLAPDFPLIQGLLSVASDHPGFLWFDGQSLVAALLTADQAVRAAQSWNTWEQANDRSGAWNRTRQVPTNWQPVDLVPGSISHSLDGAGKLFISPEAVGDVDALMSRFQRLAHLQAKGPDWIWDMVRCTGPAIAGDLAFVREGRSFLREPFGIVPDPDQETPLWQGSSVWKPLAEQGAGRDLASLDVDHPDQVFCGEGVDLAKGTALDTKHGPIILDRGVTVMPHCFLEGPLYIGPGSLVKPGSRIHGESSFGIVNRLAGEIGESTFSDFANKQHEGFIGHAVLGSWINLGAMTTCSDLKNNYGEIRVDLGEGSMSSGCRFIGLMMGDHTKTAIGSLFNTGTSVGFASNIFGTGMPPKHVGNFRWGGQKGDPAYGVEQALGTAKIVMSRRGCLFTPAHENLFRTLAGGS